MIICSECGFTLEEDKAGMHYCPQCDIEQWFWEEPDDDDYFKFT